MRTFEIAAVKVLVTSMLLACSADSNLVADGSATEDDRVDTSGSQGESDTDGGDETAQPDASEGSESNDGSGGEDESSDSGVPPPPDAESVAQLCEALGDGVHVGETRLRRLTRTALGNTLRDLVGVSPSMAETVELDESIGPFYSNAIAPVTDLIVRQYAELASRVAAEVAPRRTEIAGCTLESDDACPDRYIERLGLRTHRRPLSTEERADYRALYDAAFAEGGEELGFRTVLQVMLQTPFFLYHVDAAEPSAAAGTAVRLHGYELAARLSYFLWNSMPDDALFEAAQSGALDEPEGIEQQVDRMLADPRAQDAIPSFHLQWLAIREMQGVTKDDAMFPQFDDALRTAMLEETVAFTDYVFRRGDGTLRELLTADYSIIDGPLFELYGVDEPPDHVAGEPIALDATQRAGVLTQAAFLAKHAHPDQTSPVHRGLVIRENLMCHTIPSPPPDVDNVAPAVNDATTTRERFAQHEADPVCASCHHLIDPIGLGFEHYDPLGAWRTADAGFPVDASGEILRAGADVDGTFDGAVELAQRLAESERVANCTVNQWFRFALGRIESQDDACTLHTLYAGFEDSDGNLKVLLRELATSDAFTHVRAGEE